MSEDEVIVDFKKRIHQYEIVYEEVGGEIKDEYYKKKIKNVEDDIEQQVPYIKIINNNEKVVTQSLQGFLNLQIITFLIHLHLEERPLYLVRHGESEFHKQNRIGGDPCLTEDGVKFSKMLNKFFEDEQKSIGCEKFIVNTSTKKRCVETASYLNEESGIFDIRTPLRLLDDINAGICDGLTYDEVAEKYPEIAHGRKKDKLSYRYPKGESYYDVMNRLQPYIVELERMRTPAVVISHNAVIR